MGAYGCDIPDLMLGFGRVISKVHFAPKPPKLKSIFWRPMVLIVLIWGNSSVVRVVISKLRFATKPPKLKSAYYRSYFGGLWLWYPWFNARFWACNKQSSFCPQTPKIEIYFLKAHGFDSLVVIWGNSSVSRVVISKLRFAPKPPKLESAYYRSYFGGLWLWYPWFNARFWACNKQSPFCPQTPKIEIYFLKAHGFDSPDLRKFPCF